jgi:hypothetical protein
MNILIGIGLLALLILGMFKLFQRTDREYKELKKVKGKTLEYLTTVKKRANLSVLPEGLYMLHLELIDSCNHYEYHKDTFEEYKRIVAYIAGKYHGLRKLSHTTE